MSVVIPSAPSAPAASVNPVDGHVLAGVELEPHLFVGRVKMSQLFQIAPDPRETEDATKRAESPDLEDLYQTRLQVQRLFEGAKQRNVAPYSAYIVNLLGGAEGMTPPIILYSPPTLKVAVNEMGLGVIQVPWEVRLIALDGETQLAARIEAAKVESKTREMFVSVCIVHGRPTSFARQAFHDLNVLGVRPNPALAISMDARDPVTAITREVSSRVRLFKGRVNEKRRQLKRRDPEVVTLSALRGACVTFVLGIGGVRFGARPVGMPKETIAPNTEAAVAWFSALTEAIGPSIENRDKTVAAAPAVIAALGAVGNELTKIENLKQREVRQKELIDALRAVHWDRGTEWEGIVGKFTAKGRLTIGGSKETAYAVYAALKDTNSPGYKKVRGL